MNEYSRKNNPDLITFLTAGSVDDGKSTLIGRLLYDNGSLYRDQKKSIEDAERVEGELDFSLVTDGLSAEQEQKITIDVAYRYFSTGKRRFIIADTPGHEEYTRNMVTGASKAHVALILVDARKGMLTQSKRHLFIASLLGIRHIAVVVNKMDCVHYKEEVFENIKKEFLDFSIKLSIPDLQFIPASALKGDMVVERGSHLDWYRGRTVLDYLESVNVTSDRNLVDFRFPVQYVIRPDQDFRGYAGTLASGVVREGDTVIALPSGRMSQVKHIFVGDKLVPYAFAGQSVVITLVDDIDVSRGTMLVRPKNQPMVSDTLDSMLCNLSHDQVTIGKRYLLKIGTSTHRVVVQDIVYRIDVNTLHREQVSELDMNDIGRVVLQSDTPIICDTYEKNKHTGAYILIDTTTKQTVAAGMISGRSAKKTLVTKEVQGRVLWFTGLSGSGKTTIALSVAELLRQKGITVEHLDGDVLRSGITSSLGFSQEDRALNVGIAGFVAKKLSEHGVTVLATFVSPHAKIREAVKQSIPSFIEIYVSTPLAVCEARDVKGLYKKARAGEVASFTGVSDTYEPPEHPDLVLDTETLSVEECAASVIEYLELRIKR